MLSQLLTEWSRGTPASDEPTNPDYSKRPVALQTKTKMEVNTPSS